MSEIKNNNETQNDDETENNDEAEEHTTQGNGLYSHNFASITLTDCEFDEKRYFKQYHFYERYDPSKRYDARLTTDYGHNIHLYEHSTFNIAIWRKNEKEVRRYVVAVEQLSKEEKDALAPFCQCPLCRSPWIFIGMHLFFGGCPCCYGCLAVEPTTTYNQRVIDQSREYAKTHLPRSMKEWPAWKKYTSLIVGGSIIPLLLFIGFALMVSLMAGVSVLLHYCVESAKEHASSFILLK